LIAMPIPSPQRRNPDGRAVRRLGGFVLMIAIGVTAAGLLVARLGVWGPDAIRPRSGRGATGDRAATTGSPEQSAPETGRQQAHRGGSAPDAAGPDPAHERDGGPGEGDGDRAAPRAEDLLTLLDHMESQIAAVVERARQSVVELEYTAREDSARRRRVASGVVINDRGEILSVRIDPPRSGGSGATDKKGRDPARIMARDYLGNRYPAHWVAADQHTGLTLLRVSRGAVRPIKAAVDGPRLGGYVFVVGSPFGMGHSINRGHVAGLDRVLKLGQRQLGGLIQVQAPLYPGDSGAAVVDVRGDWLGLIRGGLAIPHAVARRPDATEPAAVGKSIAPRAAGRRDAANDGADRGGGAEADPPAEPDTDFGFAIPTRDALWIAEQLRTHRRVNRAYLGVQFEDIPGPEELIPAPEPAPSAPAASPSSAPGPDPSGSWRGAGAGPGSNVAPPRSAPDAAAADVDPPPLVGEGARIFLVKPGTPAAEAGLRPGDRIVDLDGQPIRSHSQLIDRLERLPAGKTIVLGIVRGGEPARPRSEVTVRTASRPDDPPDSVPGTGSVTPSERRSGGTSVQVTPTASQVEPATPDATGSGSNPSRPAGGSGSSPAPSDEARPGPSSASPPPSTPRPNAIPAPAPAAPDRPEPSPTAAGSSTSLDELKPTLPRAVVERIEHLERRVIELEQFRNAAGPAAGGFGERDYRARPAAPNPERERAGRPSRPAAP
jgi:S1-C subfamily serine protease